MISEESLNAVGGARLNDHFLRPRYDAFGFAQLPQTVRALLLDHAPHGVSFGPRADLYQVYDTVIVVLLDAFGWRFFEPLAERHPFLRRIVEHGLVCKLTSQFPSTTAAHVTALHTGLPVGQSGVYEWYYYEPQVDALIAPLLFSFAGDHDRETLSGTGVEPTALYPTSTLYQELQAHGVASYIFQNQLYAFSPYTRAIATGAQIMPYTSLEGALGDLAQLVEQQRQRSYYVLYYDRIDAICHRYGPTSPQLAAEIHGVLDTLERTLHARLRGAPGRTLLLVTADHGQTAIDPATTVYLNQQLPDLLPYIRTNQAGVPLVPAGSSRDLFLHIKEEFLDDAHAMLSEHMAGRAEVYRVAELIDQQFFGPPPLSQAFLSRVGNLVVLPYAGESVWWYEEGRFEQRNYGSHGGLTPDEMETLLLVQPYG